jgi:DNA-binding response OmpR family regulator
MAKKRILIAIANQFTLDVFNENFLQENFEVITVSNGNSAFQIAQEKLPDIIIADVALAEINGFEIAELLKKNNNTKKIPVIIYSRSGSSEHKEKSIDLMVNDFVNGLAESPKEIVSKVKIHLGTQKSYIIEPSENSLEKTSELANDIKENIKCPLCNKKKHLYLMRNLSAGEKDFKISFVCLDCSFQKSR